MNNIVKRKKIRVKAYCNGVLRFKSKYEKIEEVSIDNKVFFKIVLTGIHNKKTLVRGRKITLQINLCKNQSDLLHLVLKDFFIIEGKQVLLCVFNDDEYSYFEDFSIFQYSIFESWLNKEKISWRNLKTELEKQAWIRSCGRLIDLRTQKIELNEFIIDFQYINFLYDFYCLMGEVLLGYRGYIGGDFNAFSDCLYYIEKNSTIRNPIIYFKNFKLINISFQPYIEIDIINELKKYGFIVKLESLN